MRKLFDQAGDTIVEVLIAIAALAAVLGGAYATVSRAQQATQSAQERAEATKQVESQLEALKSILLAGTKTQPATGAFCINNALSDFVTISPTNPFSNTLDNDTFPYTGECGNRGGHYNVAISFNSASNDTYTIMARWDRVGARREELKMYYRIHP